MDILVHTNSVPISKVEYVIASITFSSNQSLPLVFPHQWVRSCLAVSTESGLLRWVVDGQLVEDRLADTLIQKEQKRPTDLTGKLLLGACGSWPAGWWS